MGTDAQLIGESRADGAERDLPVTQAERSSADMIQDLRLLGVRIFDALRHGDILPAVIIDENALLEGAGDAGDPIQSVQPLEGLSFREEDLAGSRLDEDVGGDVAEILLDQGIEAVVDGKDDHQGGRPDGHADGTDRRYDIDHIVRFLGEKVSAGEKKRQVHPRAY